jgi:hypothetical protein
MANKNTLSVKWEKNNPLTIHIKADDLVISRLKNGEPIKVDTVGHIRFGRQIKNKRVLMNHKVTIIIGAPIPRGSVIRIPENYDVLNTYITTMGQTASIGSEYAGQPVTLVIHGVTNEEFEQLSIAEHNLLDEQLPFTEVKSIKKEKHIPQKIKDPEWLVKNPEEKDDFIFNPLINSILLKKSTDYIIKNPDYNENELENMLSNTIINDRLLVPIETESKNMDDLYKYMLNKFVKNAIVIAEKNKNVVKRKEKNEQNEEIAENLYDPDKPWRDPDSLYCDKDFLESLLDREVECTKGSPIVSNCVCTGCNHTWKPKKAMMPRYCPKCGCKELISEQITESK